jgi:hypothetical protein
LAEAITVSRHYIIKAIAGGGHSPELPDSWKIFQTSFIDDGQDRGWSMTILNKNRTVVPRLAKIEIRNAAISKAA